MRPWLLPSWFTAEPRNKAREHPIADLVEPRAGAFEDSTLQPSDQPVLSARAEKLFAAPSAFNRGADSNKSAGELADHPNRRPGPASHSPARSAAQAAMDRHQGRRAGSVEGERGR